ncbi:hypothetical protein BDZ89DRAFT_1057703 [Hymenopellis radicata]|nr:hypothetical protein BDZ89DRAFT_1057703 [Hymenopellis radicata]
MVKKDNPPTVQPKKSAQTKGGPAFDHSKHVAHSYKSNSSPCVPPKDHHGAHTSNYNPSSRQLAPAPPAPEMTAKPVARKPTGGTN